jgi:voltage-gated sodium channel
MMNLAELRETLAVVIHNRYFELFMMSIIILSAMLIGIDTFNLDPFYQNIIFTLDRFITIIFVMEIIMRISAYDKPLHFFKDGWNVFDFVIVAVSLIPIDNNDSALARLLRIFRILRLITILPELKEILNALFRSAKSIGYVMILMFIIFYIYAVTGTIFFEDSKSGYWDDLGVAMLTLFQIMTLEGWTDIMMESMETHPYSWVFFVSFIVLTAYTFLNMIIGIIIETLNEEHKKDEKKEHQDEQALLKELVEQNRMLVKKVEALETTVMKQKRLDDKS